MQASSLRIYGDGVHDDTAAIQAQLDSGASEVVLDTPESFYLISRPLKIHGGQALKVAPTSVIRLAPNSSCSMLEDCSFSNWKEGITVDGGIWDMNNTEQEPNPYHFPGKDGKTMYDRLGFCKEKHGNGAFSTLSAFPDVYTGFCMRFCRVRGLTLKNITLRNPVTYGIQLGYVENFSVCNVSFDYKLCNPKFWNMDGIHLEGGCKNGILQNLSGACHDDLVAITADDSLYGDIENITVDNLVAEGCHSAVRLLSHGLPIRNVHVSNVRGSFYTYCIGITKYHGGPDERGVMSNISIKNVTACASVGTEDVKGGKYPFIWIQAGVDVDGLSIENIRREEKTFPTPFFKLDSGAEVKHLRIENALQKNLLGQPIPFIQILGKADGAVIKNCSEQ